MIGTGAEFLMAFALLLVLGVAAVVGVLFSAVLFTIARNRFYRRTDPRPGYVTDTTPTREAIERWYALPAVEPEHERWR